MSYRIECSVQIGAPPEAVWATIQDFTRRTLWDLRVVHAQLLTPPPQERGSRFRIVYGVPGIRSWVDAEYIVWKPTERSAIRAVGFSRISPFVSAAGSWHFDANSDGSTTWTTHVNIAMRGGPLAPILERIIVGWYFRRLTVGSQEKLKRLVEGDQVTATAQVGG